MAAVIDIVSRRGLSIDVHHTNQPNKSKLVLYKPLIHIYSHLKKLCMHTMMIYFSYKCGCGVHGHHTCIDVFKIKVSLGYI